MKAPIVTSIVLVAAASGAGYHLRHGDTGVTVKTASITEGDIIQAVTATGTLEAVQTVQVGSTVSGTVSGLYADFNSIVRKGQLIAELDPALFDAGVEQARANLAGAQASVERLEVSAEAAKATLDRSRALASRTLISPTELEAAEVAHRLAVAELTSGRAQLGQAQAALDQARVNRQHTLIYSPIDGIVISRNVDVGQTVAASMTAPTLFSIAADLTRMRLTASVSEADIGIIRAGQVVRFQVDAYPNEQFAGTVLQVRLQPTTSQNVVTYTTMIDVPNPALRLRTGMTANTTIEIARRTNVVRIPNTALRFRPTPTTLAALGQSLLAQSTRTQTAKAAAAGTPATGKPGQVWQWLNAQLEPVPVTLGISDGTYTELIGAFPRQELELVTDLTVPEGTSSSSSSRTAQSPLAPTMGPGPGMMPPPPPPGGGGPPM